MVPLHNIHVSVQLPPVLQKRGLCLTDEERSRIAGAAASSIRHQVKANFAARGGREFWMEAHDATKSKVTDDGVAVVTVEQTGVRLRWKGGVVKPKPGNVSSKTGKQTQLLALPQQKVELPGSYNGVLAYEKIQHRGALKGILLPGQVHPAKRKYKDRPAGRPVVSAAGEDVEPVFLLVTQTVHRPDPSVMPGDKAMQEAAAKGAALALKLITRNKK